MCACSEGVELGQESLPALTSYLSSSAATDHLTYRYVCWDLVHVGAVGESVLHLCVLNATSVHNDLAKRLIRHFPNLINDIYLCDEYYGTWRESQGWLLMVKMKEKQGCGVQDVLKLLVYIW